MSRTGHNWTAASLAASGAIVLWNLQPHSLVVCSWFLGALLGASAPDYLEVVYGWDERGRRKSLLNHRTWTHWPYPWFAACAVLGAKWDNGLFDYFSAGFISASLLHLAMDILTPMGIPLRWPTGKRSSLNIYKTGHVRELAVIAVTSLILIMLATATIDVRGGAQLGNLNLLQRLANL